MCKTFDKYQAIELTQGNLFEERVIYQASALCSNKYTICLDLSVCLSVCRRLWWLVLDVITLIKLAYPWGVIKQSLYLS